MLPAISYEVVTSDSKVLQLVRNPSNVHKTQQRGGSVKEANSQNFTAHHIQYTDLKRCPY